MDNGQAKAMHSSSNRCATHREGSPRQSIDAKEEYDVRKKKNDLQLT